VARPRTSRRVSVAQSEPFDTEGLTYIGPKRAALRQFERDCFVLLSGVALGLNVKELEEGLKRKANELRRQGITDDDIERSIRRAEKEIAPGLKKLTGVDVRKQGRLFENPSKIPLSKGKVALVDSQDAAKLGKHSWYYGFRGYAMRSKLMPSGRRKTVSMHREILGAKDHEEVDHINGDRLDNRRSNLRVLGRSANLHNRGAYGPSGLKGVSWDKRKKKWRAEIGKNGKRAWLGYHDTKEDAERIYRKASKKLYTGKDRAAR
jgi:hypothetical protein